MKTFEPVFRVKFRSNIRAHIRWLEHMISPAWAAQVLKNYQSSSNLNELRKLARKVFQEEVYDAYSPSRPRTGAAKESFIAVQLEGQGLGVRSDPSVATSVGPFSSGSPEQFSYAAFFDNPGFNSFLPPKDNPTHPAKHRPFMAPMTHAVNEFAKEQAMRATIKAVTKKMPRRRSNADG